MFRSRFLWEAAKAGAGAAAAAAAAPTIADAYAASASTMKGAGKTRCRTSMSVSLTANSAGALCDLLQVFKNRGVNISQVANRPRAFESEAKYRTIFLDVDEHVEAPAMQEVLKEVRQLSPLVSVQGSWVIPWYPTCPAQLDDLDQSTLAAGEELQDDPENPHPGFHDEVYRARRREIVANAKTYKTGEPVPLIEYTEEENRVWTVVYDRLSQLYPTHACEEFNYVFPLLMESGVLNRTKMPQLRDVSDFLHQATGFTVRPVAGLLSPRDFLSGLAFRVFFSTQYIRHGAQPLYTPEPDMVHDIIGHLPLLSDPHFANFTQTIGLASLGADDELLDKLGKLYWYTVEYGMCEQGGSRRAYGAGILSSIGELEYCMSGKPKFVEFDPAVACVTPQSITKMQETYFVAKSFQDMQVKLEKWLNTQDKPLYLVYNSYSKTIQSYPKNTWRMLSENMRRLKLLD